MLIEEKALKIMEQPVCDHCLGRQFSQLLSGFTNRERGRALRIVTAMSIDVQPRNIDISNLYGLKLRRAEIDQEKKKCSICMDIFEGLEKYARNAVARSRGVEFSTFLVGTRPSSAMINSEEALWERVGIDFCEPIKAEINREIGKLTEKLSGKKFSKSPDITFLVDLNSGKIGMSITPLFIYGEYQKLKRGIPQTRWPSGKYKTSVEQITAKPFMKASSGIAHKFHASGREDIDARCLAWRPFVLEILEPKKRAITINKLAKKIGKAVKVRKVRFSGISEVRKLKEARIDKTYKALVKCENNITKGGLSKIKKITEIAQQTPQRVLHRRANLNRKRHVRSIKAKYINSRTFEITVRAESGLYIKELISGDNGRTKPSVSEMLGVRCKCVELDVIDIHTKK